MSSTLLIRYGMIPEVARFRCNLDGELARGVKVVVRTHRGLQLGTMLDTARVSQETADAADNSPEWDVIRIASADDEQTFAQHQDECNQEFSVWRERLTGWKLNLELVELEWTLDRENLILYVLNDNGPECAKLAVYAAVEGWLNLAVQPVNAGGPVAATAAGSCGSGCSSGGCCS